MVRGQISMEPLQHITGTQNKKILDFLLSTVLDKCGTVFDTRGRFIRIVTLIILSILQGDQPWRGKGQHFLVNMSAEEKVQIERNGSKSFRFEEAVLFLDTYFIGGEDWLRLL